MRVLVTGASGFIGKNLIARLEEHGGIDVLPITRESSPIDLARSVEEADFIFHLAGVNRPQHVSEFAAGNVDLTLALCNALKASGRKTPIVYTSSIQAERDNPYGISKRGAEQVLLDYQMETGSRVYIYRLPNVFGKWCRPNYNSAVATFCHNISRNLPIQVNDPDAMVALAYIDDVVDAFIDVLEGRVLVTPYIEVAPVYNISVGALAAQLSAFRDSRVSLVSERVGTGLTRALYSTYVSYLPTDGFIYELPKYSDSRGVFVEMLKTKDSGQFSYFTAGPGITRGGHYHHSKTEKFLVIKGEARFGFRHIVTDEYYSIHTSGSKPEIVETVPGWTHDITNVGEDEMIVMLWANEIFDRERPDTFTRPVNHEKT